MSRIHEGPLVQSDSVTCWDVPIAENSSGTDITLTDYSKATIDKTVSSLCPVCLKVVSAHIFQENGKVLMEKECDDHGSFREIYWSDAILYKRFIKYLQNGHKSSNSAAEQKGCPLDCGICKNHITNTLLGNIDLTSRCNMACPICFADAGGDHLDPSLDEIWAMMKNLRAEKPVPCPASTVFRWRADPERRSARDNQHGQKIGFFADPDSD